MTKPEREAFLLKLKETCVIADAAALAEMERDKDDGGTCNFDSAFIRIPPRHGIKQSDLDKIHKEIGVSLDLSEYHGPVIFVHPSKVGGQGFLRTRMAEKMRKALKAADFNTSMYYQMD